MPMLVSTSSRTAHEGMSECETEAEKQRLTLEGVARPHARQVLLARHDELAERLMGLGVWEVLLEVLVGDEGLCEETE